MLTIRTDIMKFSLTLTFLLAGAFLPLDPILALRPDLSVGPKRDILSASSDNNATSIGLPNGDISRCCSLLSAAGFDPRAPGGLPLVLIDTHGQTIPDPHRIDATLCTCGSPSGGRYI